MLLDKSAECFTQGRAILSLLTLPTPVAPGLGSYSPNSVKTYFLILMLLKINVKGAFQNRRNRESHAYYWVAVRCTYWVQGTNRETKIQAAEYFIWTPFRQHTVDVRANSVLFWPWILRFSGYCARAFFSWELRHLVSGYNVQNRGFQN